MTNNKIIKILAAISYLAMITTNALANIIPINGNNTGEVSNAYPNLFAPAGITFSIWGIIYTLLAGYILYQFGLFQKDNGKKNLKLFAQIDKFLIINSIANIFWIFAWHYRIIGLSLILIVTVLVSLIKIADIIKSKKYSIKETLFIRAPFSVYFGWASVATIANVAVFLVSINWNGFGLSDQFWMILVLLIGAIIGITRTVLDKNIFFGSVFIWAYIGILIKHTAANGFNYQYPIVINTIIFCLILFFLTIGFVSQKTLVEKK